MLALTHVDESKVRWAEELNRLAPIDLDAPTGVPAVLRSSEPELVPRSRTRCSSRRPGATSISKPSAASACARTCAFRSWRGADSRHGGFVSAESGRVYRRGRSRLRGGARAPGRARRRQRAAPPAGGGGASPPRGGHRALAEGVYALGLSGASSSPTSAAQKMLGWTEQELPRPRHARGDPLPAARRQRLPARVPTPPGARPEEIVQRDDDAYIRKDGTYFPVAYTCSPIVTDGVVRAPSSPSTTSPSASGRRPGSACSSRQRGPRSVARLRNDPGAPGSDLGPAPRGYLRRRRRGAGSARFGRSQSPESIQGGEELVRELERRYQTDPDNELSPVGRVLGPASPCCSTISTPISARSLAATSTSRSSVSSTSSRG